MIKHYYILPVYTSRMMINIILRFIQASLPDNLITNFVLSPVDVAGTKEAALNWANMNMSKFC